MPLTKTELFRRIRSDAVLGELSIRALARKHGVHRRLVREALTYAEPTPRRQLVRRSPLLDPVKKTIDEWLRADLEAPRKQRHTARRIKDRLAQEMDTVIPHEDTTSSTDGRLADHCGAARVTHRDQVPGAAFVGGHVNGAGRLPSCPANRRRRPARQSPGSPGHTQY
jgi:hypothetical protein